MKKLSLLLLLCLTAYGSYVTLPSSGGGGGGNVVDINSDASAHVILNTGTSGSDFGIDDSVAGTHTFNIPSSSGTKRGLLSSSDWTTFNNKAPTTSPTFGTSVTLSYATASVPLVTDGSKNAVSMSYATFLSNLPNFVGDGGAGGTAGIVPAPGAGDAAAGKFLKADGTWTAPSGGGVTTMAAVGSTPNANGASISGVTLTLQPYDGTHPGVTTTGAQTVGGVKTFSSAPVFSSVTASQVLSVDSGKSLSSLAYDNADTHSALVQRDASGNFTANTITSDAAAGTNMFVATNANGSNKCQYGFAVGQTTGMCYSTDTDLHIQRSSTNYIVVSSNAVYTAAATPYQSYLHSGNKTVWNGHGLHTFSTTACNNSASAADTNCFSTTLGNGDWNINGASYKGEFGGSFTGSDTDRRIRIVLGSTTLVDTSTFSVTTSQSFHGRFLCTRVDATHEECSTTVTANTAAGVASTWVNEVTANETLASDLTLKMMLNSTTASTTVGKLWRVWFDGNG